MLKGIDISEWQEAVNFAKVKKQIDFIILREGYRQTIDKRFLEYVRGCKAANIPIHGVYHFIYALNNQDAKAEAKSCIANVVKAGLSKSTRIWCDLEYDSITNAQKHGVTLGENEINLFTDTFCSYIKSQGYPTGIYTNWDFYKNRYREDVLRKYDIWMANYSGMTPTYLYQQYSDKGKVDGIQGNVDMDYYFGSEESKKESDATMGVRMSNCGHDERNKYSGGQAGDQTGNEWYLRAWYAYPWNYVIRWKDAALGNLFADLAVEAAENNLVGYDQNQRDTFWTHLKASGYRPSKITVACEADCSSGTVALIKAVGHLKGIKELQNCNATYTGNMMEYFRSANGKKYFEVLTGRYLADSSLAKRGDINLNIVHHVNITVDNGANAGSGASSSGGSAGTSSGSSAVLRKGSTGAAVKTMQAMLIACGYSCGDSGADGDFGSGTLSALKAFQRANKLVVDGEYGPASKAALEALYKHLTDSNNKTVADIAREVIAGKWGNGTDRKKKLEAAGYDYAAVQKEVNKLL